MNDFLRMQLMLQGMSIKFEIESDIHKDIEEFLKVVQEEKQAYYRISIKPTITSGVIAFYFNKDGKLLDIGSFK